MPVDTHIFTHAHKWRTCQGIYKNAVASHSFKMSSTISPEQVAESLGLDAKRLEEQCDESSFPSLRNLVHPWRLVFSNLLTPVDLDDVDSEYSSRPEEEKRLGCLRKWKARVGAQATFKAIVQAVLMSGSIVNAEAICQHLLQKPGMHSYL